ncbi:MAG: ABC transporter substrate-binding protein [Eggerthellaceae bacterium]
MNTARSFLHRMTRLSRLKGLVVCAFALCLLCVLAGCSNASDNASSSDNQASTLTVAWTSNQGDYSLDPTDNYMGWQGSYLGIYEQLYRIDGNFNINPMLAESSETTDEGTTWVLHIRDGVTFQNGKAVDAAAVQKSLQRAIDKSARCKASLNVASMSADGQTLTISLNEPNLYFINELAEPVTSIIDADSGTPDNMPVGTGPFSLQSIDDNGNAELNAYEDYWQGKPATDHVKALYLTDDTSKVNALQSGEVQALMNVGDDQLANFQNNPDYTVHQTNQARAHMLYFNLQSPVMKDAKVREALSMCVDRDTYVTSLYSGAAQAATGVFPDQGGWDEGVSQPSYNLDKAKQLLAEAGYSDSDGDGYLDKDGQPLSLTFVTYQANAGLPKICEAMSSALNQIGVQTKVEVAEKIADRLQSGNWDVGTLAINTLPTGNPLTYLQQVMQSSGNENYGHYDNPQIDDLIAQLKVTADSDEQHKLVSEIQNLAFQDHAYVYVVHALVNDVCSSQVQNLAMQGQYDWLNYQTSVEN